MSVRTTILITAAFNLCGLTAQSGAAEVEAEASRDAGTDYASAVRIRITDNLEKPSGKSAQWRGVITSGDTGDGYKFSPTPVRGQLMMLGLRGDGGAVQARFVDRKTGETIAETEEKDGTAVVALLVDKSMMLIIEPVENGNEIPYSATIIRTRPEEMGLASPDAATQAFAEAMKRKPKMIPPPEGFSLIKPPEGNGS